MDTSNPCSEVFLDTEPTFSTAFHVSVANVSDAVMFIFDNDLLDIATAVALFYAAEDVINWDKRRDIDKILSIMDETNKDFQEWRNDGMTALEATYYAVFKEYRIVSMLPLDYIKAILDLNHRHAAFGLESAFPKYVFLLNMRVQGRVENPDTMDYVDIELNEQLEPDFLITLKKYCLSFNQRFNDIL
jgi:hypothetical protein